MSAALLTALSYRLANKQGKLRAFSVVFVTLERGATIHPLGKFPILLLPTSSSFFVIEAAQ